MTSNERKELVNYRMNKARETFSEIDLLIQHKLWNTAINRLYYACYYAVIALLLTGKSKRSHILAQGRCLDFIL